MNTVNYNDAEQLFGAVGTSLKKHKAEIADIVNVYGAKNLLPNNATSQTLNGVTFTVNSDGSVTANGTATANTALIVGRYEFKANQNVILSGCPSTGGPDTYKLLSWPTTAPSSGRRQKEDVGQGVLLDYPDNLTCQIQIWIANGQVLNNITFYPMIRLASIEDDTYVPYVPTNAELLSADTNAVLGAHNFLNCTLASIKSVNTMGTWNNNVYTLNGVTFTINNDLSVSISGTASNNCIFVFKLKEDISLIESKKYSGISGGSSSTIWLLVEYYNNNSWVGEKKIYDGTVALIAPSTANKVNLEVYVKSGASINKTIYPLLSLASDPSTAYAPYAKTNKELTDDISSLAARIKAIEDVNHLTWG